uniref:Uncharacterized protein n=1 Tax=Salix viminalis TaxID=40686 RepID=A0A6N2KIN7_SALVM
MDGWFSFFNQNMLHQGIGIWKYCAEALILFLQSLDALGREQAPEEMRVQLGDIHLARLHCKVYNIILPFQSLTPCTGLQTMECNSFDSRICIAFYSVLLDEIR